MLDRYVEYIDRARRGGGVASGQVCSDGHSALLSSHGPRRAPVYKAHQTYMSATAELPVHGTFSASDSFSTMALYKFIYLLTYLPTSTTYVFAFSGVARNFRQGVRNCVIQRRVS